MPEKERLQKVLASAGLGSRRACEEIILQGRVTVNGQVAQLGQSADPVRDRIAVDGKLVRPKKEHTYIALYKPVGVVSTARDEEGRQAVVDLVQSALEKERGEKVRLYPVGRLDLLSEGLVLLTDDGELAQRLMHPRYEHTKEYNVAVSGSPSEETLQRWRDGVELEDGMAAPTEVTVLRREGGRTWLDIVMHEGRNREIRRVAELLGYPATQLIRVRIGPVELGALRPGEWRHLTGPELKELRKLKGQAASAPRAEKEPTGRGKGQAAPAKRADRERGEKSGSGKRPRSRTRGEQEHIGARKRSPTRSSRTEQEPAGPDKRRPYRSSRTEQEPAGPDKRRSYRSSRTEQEPAGPDKRRSYRSSRAEQEPAGPDKRRSYRSSRAEQEPARPGKKRPSSSSRTRQRRG